MVIRTLALAFLTLAPFAAHAQGQDLPRLAVFSATVTPAAKKSFGELSLDPGELTRQIEEGLRASRRFELYERAKEVTSETIDAEQQLAKDPESFKNDGVAALGQKLKVQFIVYPMVTSVNIAVRKMPMDEAPGRFRYSVSGAVAVTTKLLDTSTGQIAYQATRETALPPLNDVGKGVNGGNDGAIVTGDAWRSLARSAALQITNAVVGTLFPLQVMQASGQDIFINRGEGAGIEVGDVYQLFAAGEALIDPVTKEKLGDAETLLGDVKVIRVTPRFSVVRAVSPLSGQPKAGDIARPLPK